VQGLNPEEIFEGYSLPRNKEIMRIFKDLEMVEYLGSGMPRILRFYDRKSFKITDNFLRMIFPNAWNLSEDDATAEITPNDSNIESKASQNDGSPGGLNGGPIGGLISGSIGGLIELTDRQLEVLSLIHENNKITKVGIAAKLNINVSAVLKHLLILKQKGVLKRIGGTRGHWQVMFTKTFEK